MAMETISTSLTGSEDAIPLGKLSRYRSVRKAAATAAAAAPAADAPPHLSLSEAAQSPAPTTSNESIKRSMSRYRKRPSRLNDAAPPPLPSKPISQPNTPQVHAESLAALTGEVYSCSKGPQSPGRTKLFNSSQPQNLDAPEAVDPRLDALLQSSTVNKPASAEKNILRRPLSWESDAAELDLRTRPDRIPEKESTASTENSKYVPRAAVQNEIAQDHGHARQYASRTDIRGESEESQRPWKLSSGTVRKRSGAAECADMSGNDYKTSAANGSQGMNTSPASPVISTMHRMPSNSDRAAYIQRNAAMASNFGVAAWFDAPTTITSSGPHLAPRTAASADVSSDRSKQPDNRPMAAPQHDAPVSAVNAGPRHVLVKSASSVMKLPVDPSTTPQSLISSAAEKSPTPIDVNDSKVVENFTQLGLERPLRNYEHVRDVMNSWDNDAQHALVVSPSSPETDAELQLKHAPRKEPKETSMYLYHSQRPGTWDKRWITLRADGQLTISKRQGHEAANLCHLSDFDIYRPTARHQSKKLKPPRKFCFAVKSMQKSNVFLDGSNYVHFFATRDEAVAAAWYRAVQRWRSWYLVHILGDGEISNHRAINGHHSRPKRSSSPRRPSLGDTPDQSGSPRTQGFGLSHSSSKLSRSNTTTSSAARSDGQTHMRSLPSRNAPGVAPPSAFPASKLTRESSLIVMKDAPCEEAELSTFAPSGLLGNTYSAQKQMAEEREGRSYQQRLQSRAAGDSNAFTTASPTYNDTSLHAPLAAAAASTTTTLTRKSSTRSTATTSRPRAAQNPPSSAPQECMPALAEGGVGAAGGAGGKIFPSKPLVDLTPQYQEPPQHLKKGKGVAAAPGQRLVDVATGLDHEPGAIVTPSARAWRRPPPPPGPI